MRRLLAALAFSIVLISGAQAADCWNNTAGTQTDCGAVQMFLNPSSQAIAASAANPLPVVGTFSATLGGFAPAGTFATLTATASSASVALPAGAVVIFQNTGTTAVSCTLGVGSATATVSQNIVQPASWLALTVGSNTFGACIDVTGSASNLVALSGGAGLPTGAGGGGGSGGGGAVTMASTAVASGAYSAGSLAAGAGVDGWDLTQGAKGDAAWVSGSGSVIAILKNLAAGIANGVGTFGSAMPVTGLAPGLYDGTNLVRPKGDETSGAWVNVKASVPLTASPVAAATGGASAYHVLPAASDNHAVIKNGAGTAYSAQVTNNSATKNYMRLYDAGTGFNGCNSATGIIWGMEIPPTDGGFSVMLGGPVGMIFSTGLSICVTSGYGDTDTTNATATALIVNVQYK